MGLDMYLYRGPRKLDFSKSPYSSEIELAVYWRKANQIHNWFVTNVQDGEDDQGIYEVTKEQLETLLDILKRVQADHSLSEELLPTQEGFFFGGTAYDDSYFEDVDTTIVSLEKIIAETDFEEQKTCYSCWW